MSQTPITKFFSATTQKIDSIEGIEGFNHNLSVDGWKEANSALADYMVSCESNKLQICMLIPVFTGGELVGWEADDVEVISVYQVVDVGRRIIIEVLQPLESIEQRYCIPTSFEGKLMVLNELGIRSVVKAEQLKDLFPSTPVAAHATGSATSNKSRDLTPVPPQLPTNASSSKQLELEQKI